MLKIQQLLRWLTRCNLVAGVDVNFEPNVIQKARTSPQGFAIKLGSTLCCMPILLARNLKRMALSAIRKAFVYASAVSNTPGPVSVSMTYQIRCRTTAAQRTMAFDVDLKFDTLIEQLAEVTLIKLSTQ